MVYVVCEYVERVAFSGDLYGIVETADFSPVTPRVDRTYGPFVHFTFDVSHRLLFQRIRLNPFLHTNDLFLLSFAIMASRIYNII